MYTRTYAVYILSNSSRTLYVGVTNDLIRRIFEQRSGTGSKFTRLHDLHSLVWFETTEDVISAIEREKQIKSWKRDRKLALIESTNRAWVDLSPEIGLPVAQRR
jgi:putative endonuclease